MEKFEYRPGISSQIRFRLKRLPEKTEIRLRKGLNVLKRDEEKKTSIKIYLETYERREDVNKIQSIFSQLPQAFDDLTKEEVMRYFKMPHHSGRSLGYHIVAHNSYENVRNKIYELSYAREILEMEGEEEGKTVAQELMDSKYIKPAEKARVLSTLGIIDKSEEELTRLIISNLIAPNYARESTISFVLLNPEFIEMDYPAGLNPVYEVLADDIGMSMTQVNKLAKAIDDAGTNVKKALAAKTLSHLYVYYGMTNHREMFDYIMDNCPTNKLLDALDHFPSLIGLQYLISSESRGLLESDGRPLLTMQDITEILTSGNIEQEFMNRVAARIEGMLVSFKSSFDLKGVGEEGKEALKDRNFLIDLLLFESKYDYEPKRILNLAATEFLEKGTLNFKELKFKGHELANEQLGSSLKIRANLMELDSLSVSHLQKSAIPFDFFQNAIRNYQNHQHNLQILIEGIGSHSSGELSRLVLKAKDQELKRLIADRDFEGLRAHRAKGNDAKIKGRAIWALNLQNSKESADAAEGLIKELLELKNRSAQEQESIMIALSHKWRDNKYRWVAESLAALKQHATKNGELAADAINELLSIISTLNEYNLDAERNTIAAKITFDFGKLLTFGRYGSSGAGNCQRSTGSTELNQSLMSMVLDSNQFMIIFSKPDAQPVGFMQMHLLETEDRGAIFLLEDPYTNEPDKTTGMKESAALLARKIKESTGISCYTYGEGDEAVVKVPKSYVKRYIDFAGGSVGGEAFTKRLNIKEL